jgi:hypothetical protein
MSHVPALKKGVSKTAKITVIGASWRIVGVYLHRKLPQDLH